MGTNEKARQAVPQARFICEGEYWTLGFEDRLIRLRDSKGLRLIARLLREAGREFHVLDMGPRKDAGELDSRASRLDREDLAKLTVRSTMSDGDDELVDAQARAEYQRRAVELTEELEEAREFGDEERVARIEDEIDLVGRELKAAYGLSGQSRKAGSTAERARVNITKNIGRALDQIEAKHESLGRFFKSTIKTGIFCSYNPNSDFPIKWAFEAEIRTAHLTQPVAEERRVNSAAVLLRDVAHRRPLVGREAEKGVLRHLFEEVATTGRGALALIAGPPGVGKTRLIADLATEAAAAELLIGHCYEGEGVPYQPFVEILENITGRAEDAKSLRSLLGEDAVEIARLLPNLRRTLTDLPPPLNVGPEQARRLMFQAVCRVLGRALGARPGLMIIEELHWADESTLSMLLHLVHQLPELRVLLIGSYRDSALDVHPALAKILEDLTRNRSAAELSLKGLTRDGTGQLVMSMSARTPPRPLVETIFKETDGNPFFVEELLRFLEQENRLYDAQGEFRSDIEIGENDAPQSVRLVVGRRLERLTGDTRRILATAAVIGRSFSLKLLAASTGEEVDATLDCAEEAQAGGFLSSGAGGTYVFRHELVRQAVLSRLSIPRLERHHLAVANTIEHLHADSLDDHATEIVFHLRHAGPVADPERAVKFLIVAAERAFQQGALNEAEGAYRDALALLLRLPESVERDVRELKILSALSVVLHNTKGYGASERAEVTARARELAEERGDRKRLYLNLFGSWQVALGRGDYKTSKAIAEQYLELVQSEDSRLHDEHAGTEKAASWARSYVPATAHAINHVSCYYLGDLQEGERHFARACELYSAAGVSPVKIVPGLLSYASWTAWKMGRIELARARMAESLTAAEGTDELEQKFIPAMMAAMEIGLFPPLEREALAVKVIELCEKFGVPGMAGQGRIDVGRARVELGQAAEGLALIREGIAAKEQAVSRLAHTHNYTVLAEAQALVGAVDEALISAEKAVEINPQELVDRSEAYRVRGELRFRKGLTELAEQDFREAVALSRKMSAKMLELRATASLARLLRNTNRRDEARAMLTEIYNWFTEGFDTADLKDAKALLQDLEP